VTVPVGLLFTEPNQQPLSVLGKIQPGCYRNFYFTRSTTLAPIYQDGFLQLTITPPVTSDANGRFSPIFLDPNITYRTQLFSVDNRLLEDQDPIVALPPGITPAAFGYVVTSPTAVSRASTIVPVADPNLKINIPGPGIYFWDALLEFITTGASGATPGLNIVPVFSGGMQDHFASDFQIIGSMNAVGIFSAGSFTTGAGAGTVFSYSLAGASALNALLLRGVFKATSPGVLSINWAQQTSSATATTLNAGSYLRV
jgi:hypothetical protein